MNKDNEDTYRTPLREKSHLSPTGHRPSLEQFGSMKIEFLQDNRANPKEWSVSIYFPHKTIHKINISVVNPFCGCYHIL